MCTYPVQVFAATVTMAALTSAADLFTCHGDVCNRGGQLQFCHPDYKMCWNCENIRDKCEHHNLPQNCTAYCVEMGVQKELKKEREKPCPPLKNIPNGDHNASAEPQYAGGTIAVTKCHPEFHIVGQSQTACGDFGIWSRALPTCEPDDNDAYHTILIAVLAVVIPVSLLCYLTCCIKWWRSKYKERTTRRSSLEPSDEIETTKKLIEREGDEDKDASHRNDTHLKDILPPKIIPEKDAKHSGPFTPVGALVSNKGQAAKPCGVETTAVKSEFQGLNPALNNAEDRCRPEQLHTNSSVTLATQLDTFASYNLGTVQKAGLASCPSNLHAGRHQGSPQQPRAVTSRLSMPKVTTNGVQPTSTKDRASCIPSAGAGAEGPPVANGRFGVASETVDHPEDNGDIRKAEIAINERNIKHRDIKDGL